MPQVWPVIATRGRSEWLEKQLDALCPQLQGDERIIVVVDGDDYPEREIEGKVQVVTLRDSLGADKAKRLGIALVPADAVVCEIDDHDLAEPDLIVELRTAFADPEIMTAYCDCYLAHDTSGPPEMPADQAAALTTIEKEQAAWLAKQPKRIKEKKYGRYCDTGNLGYGMRAYRKWAYDLVGGYPQQWFPANDYALLCMIEQLCPDSARHIHKPLVTVLEGNGITVRNKPLQDRQMVAIATLGLRGAFSLPFASPDGQGRQQTAIRATTAATGPRAASVTARPIPKLIHFVWIGPPMPEWAQVNIERFRRVNPGYMFLVHGEEVLLDKWRTGYDRIKGEHQWSRRSDILRVSALLKFGGWYFDCDFLPIRPLADIYDAYSNFPAGCFLTQGTPELVANGVIGAAVNNEFFARLIPQLESLLAEDRERAWSAFGPRLYTQMAQAHPSLVQIGRTDMFYPIPDRAEARRLYGELSPNFALGKLAQVFAGREMPYMIHLGMQDELEL